MVKISVIIPVYNVEKYLPKMLDSICGQSFRDIEMICVDDGSTDQSLHILREYEKKDNRIVVLQQENSGAGIARNTGMKAAQGEYLSILDSDDFFEPDMLQKAYRKCKKDHADICVFRSDRYDTQSGKYEAIPWTIQQKYLPKHVPFSPQEIYPYLFQIFNGWSWDKLYRRDVVANSGLTFQGLRTTNDAFFVFLMNLQAKRITIVDEVLAHHRVNLNTSLSVTREKSWDCCWSAISAIREELIKRGQYEAVERSFINWALHFLLWNVHSLKQAEIRQKLLCQIREQYVTQLNLDKYPQEYFYCRGEYQEYRNLCQPDSIKKIIRQLYLRMKIKILNKLRS